MEIQGRPAIDYLLERLGFSRNVERIVLATTTKSTDDPLVDYAAKKEVRCYRGSEHDVVKRCYEAARQFDLDHILRITADCPLIDHRVCDEVVNLYFSEKADYVHTGPSFAEGLDCEIFSLRVLREADENAKSVIDREYLSTYIKDHRERYKIVTAQNRVDDSKYRFTIDEPEDFQVVEAVIHSLYRKGSPPFGVEDIKMFLDAHPEILRKNEHIIRNQGFLISLENAKRKAT